MTTEGAQDY